MCLTIIYNLIFTLGNFNFHIHNSSHPLCFLQWFFFPTHLLHSFPLLTTAWLLPTVESSHLQILTPSIPLSNHYHTTLWPTGYLDISGYLLISSLQQVFNVIRAHNLLILLPFTFLHLQNILFLLLVYIKLSSHHYSHPLALHSLDTLSLPPQLVKHVTCRRWNVSPWRNACLAQKFE